jgi:outer membrane receptor protein involved in Fe transport
MTERLDLQIGGRLSENRQTIEQKAVIDPSAVFLFGPSSIIGSKSEESVGTWLASARYQIESDMMAYVRLASGYRPGGPNPPVLGASTSYDSDSVVSYEFGMKGSVLDRLLTFEIAAFHIDWEDIQILATQASGVGFNTNGGEARSRGLELVAQFSPWTGMTVTANGSWTDAELTEALPPPPSGGTSAIGSPGERLPYSAELSGNLSLEQRWDLDNGYGLSASLNYSHVGSRLGQFPSTAAQPAYLSRLKLPSYETIDANISVTKNDWTFSIFGRNLSDERGMINLDNKSGISPVITASYIRPRIFGVSVGKIF